MTDNLYRNLGLDLVRVTEAAAVVAGRWMGLGNVAEADTQASEAMAQAFETMDLDGHIVIGEERKSETHSPLETGWRLGSGSGPSMDLVVDAVEGARLLARGQPDVIAVAGAAPRGSMWSPHPAAYMEKIIVDRVAAQALVEECIDAPAAWTLALVARVKDKDVRDLVVFILDRPRHRDLIDEVRAAGARVLLRSEGDVAGALMAASEEVDVDILMGIGGVSEGVIAACGVKALGGAMLGRLAPQTDAELEAVLGAELDTRKIMTLDELVRGNEIFFSATGITDGVLLKGVRYRGREAQTQSLVLRCETRTRRIIEARHLLF